MGVRRIHQFFWPFPPQYRSIRHFPLFQKSMKAFQKNKRWKYHLWRKSEVLKLCRLKYPHLLKHFKSLKYEINRLDMAKYMVANSYGGIIADLDVIPQQSLDKIIKNKTYLFDRCSRKNIIANDFFYVPKNGLPGLPEFVIKRSRHTKQKKIYNVWKMKSVFYSTGPDALTRYLRNSKLDQHCEAISDRIFKDEKTKCFCTARKTHNLPST